MASEQIICDTDVMIDYLNAHSARHVSTKYILEENIGLENIFISAVTKMEMLIGARNKSDIRLITKYLYKYNITLLNDEVTLLAIKLLEKYNLSHGLALPDALIAATVVTTKMKLFTYNLKDFKFIDGLILYNDF